MEDQVLQSGWKKLTSDTENEYLYISIPVSNLAAGLKLVSSAVSVIAKYGFDKTCHLSLDGYAVTISLNSPADKPLNDQYYKLAMDLHT